MNKRIATIILFFFSSIVFSQDYLTEFNTYLEANDTTNQLRVLKQWELGDSTNAELFTSYFNYYFLKSKQELLSLTTEASPNGEGLELKDSLGQTAGFLVGEVYYNQVELKKGFNKINEGIALYPNRLDMRFGKIYSLAQIEDWDSFTSEIIKSIDQSVVNNNHWFWTNNEKYNGGQKEFLLDIQSYQLLLYDTGNDDLLLNMREIANVVLQYYPNHVESLSNVSITYLITGEYDKGIETLLKAEQLNPEDEIVLSNIAHAYKLKGDVEQAKIYYEKLMKYGDDNAKNFAWQQIAALKNE